MIFQNNKTGLRIKTMLSILVSFGLVKVLSPVVFIANTPQVNPNLAADLLSLPARSIAFLQNPTEPTDSSSNLPKVEIGQSAKPKEGLEYKPLMNGVYAAEDPATGKKYAKIVAGTKLQKEEVKLSDGRVVTVYVPVQ